jgi:YHS domain-containing protein
MFVVSPSLAEGEQEKAKAEEKPAVELKNQTHCPVMGGKIDSTTYTDIQGQRVYHCCPACEKPMRKDPDKYFKKAAAAGMLFENIQTTCPVSGEELKKKTAFVDHEGRRVYLCCMGCESAFNKDPQKYLAALDKKAEDSKKKEEDAHKGHNH